MVIWYFFFLYIFTNFWRWSVLFSLHLFRLTFFLISLFQSVTLCLSFSLVMALSKFQVDSYATINVVNDDLWDALDKGRCLISLNWRKKNKLHSYAHSFIHSVIVYSNWFFGLGRFVHASFITRKKNQWILPQLLLWSHIHNISLNHKHALHKIQFKKYWNLLVNNKFNFFFLSDGLNCFESESYFRVNFYFWRMTENENVFQICQWILFLFFSHSFLSSTNIELSIWNNRN